MPHRISERPTTGRMPEQRDPPPPDPEAVAAALERIRSSLHRWLDRLDDLAEAAPTPGPGGADGPPADLLLEERQRRAALQAELERRVREWDAQLEALEGDRRLLAEAWERLEREQVAALSRPRPADEPARAAPALAASPAARYAADADDAIDRAIIRQFEQLRKDVRRKAEAGGVGRP